MLGTSFTAQNVKTTDPGFILYSLKSIWIVVFYAEKLPILSVLICVQYETLETRNFSEKYRFYVFSTKKGSTLTKNLVFST